MTMPCANNTCHCAGLIYTELVGGNTGCGKKYSGACGVGGGGTVTVKLQLVVPLISLAVLLTVVVPSPKLLPEGGVVFTVGTPPQESLAVTVKNTLVGTLEITVMFGGQVIESAQLGWHHCHREAAIGSAIDSYAVLVTVVVPSLKLLPEGGIEFTVGTRRRNRSRLPRKTRSSARWKSP